MTELRYVVAPITRVEVRDPTRNDDNTWTMSGYAAVFNQETVLYDGRFMRVREQIAPTFFDEIMRDQPMSDPGGVVHYNFGHDMTRAVAATDVPAGQPGSLRLSVHAGLGLNFLAKVPRDDPDGVALASKMRSGVVRQASFAFTIAQDGMETVETELDDGRTEYFDTLTRGEHLYDVCACAQGAYSQAVSGLRSYAAMLGQPVDMTGGHQRQPDMGGANAVNPERGGGGDITPLQQEQMDISAVLARAARLKPIAVGLTGKDRDVRSGHPADADDKAV